MAEEENKPETFECDLCGDIRNVDVSCIAPNGDDIAICQECHDADTNVCGSCDDRYWTEDMLRHNGDSYCERCYRSIIAEELARGEGSILPYSHRPTPKFHQQAAERGHRPPYFGIELEVENVEDVVHREEMAEDISQDFMYCKDDGSLSNGFEIVTHPLSEGWINKNRGKFRTILTKLKENGYKSYQTSTCGIHIHISKSSFTTAHLYRFMKFFYDNHALILVMSQRREALLSRWAKLGTYTESQLQRMADKKFRSSDRYTAVNLTANTAEVRIFRGTLHDVSFFKNLEFLASLFRFTKGNSIISPSRYFDWVKKHKDEYSNLDAFLSRKTVQIDMATGCVYDRSKLKGDGGSDEQDQRTEI